MVGEGQAEHFVFPPFVSLSRLASRMLIQGAASQVLPTAAHNTQCAPPTGELSAWAAQLAGMPPAS